MRALTLAGCLLLAACGAEDETPGASDAMADAMPDVMADAMADAMPDVMADAMPDAMPDAFACNGDPSLCDRPFDEVAYATAHNAMSSQERRWGGPNQGPAVPTQLADGIRGLMLDTHLGDDGTPQLCHGFCALGQQDLTEGLAEIAAFLDATPGAVITLILESYVDPGPTVAAFTAAGLAERAYTHPPEAPWPTLRALIDGGTPLVVLTDDRQGPSGAPWLMYVWDHAFETPFSNQTPDDLDCERNRGTPGAPLFILNHFLTDPIARRSLAEQVNPTAVIAQHATDCAARFGRIANFVTVDFYEMGGVLEAVRALNGL